MADGDSTLNHSFIIPNIDVIGVPQASNIYNQFDEFGLLTSLPRLPQEDNATYKHRLLDVYINRANSTYVGLINGITRELGLSLYQPFRIYPKKQGSEFIAENPVVVFNGPFIELWRDYYNQVLELEVDRFNQDSDIYTMADLAIYINNNSSYFTVDLVDEDVKYNRAMCIINQSNIVEVKSELIPLTERFTLQNPGLTTSDSGGGIILETIYFSDRDTFKTRVSTVTAVKAPGTYYLDRYTGNVVVYDTPSPGTTIRYSYIVDYFRPLASPIIIQNLQHENVKRKMFEQILVDNGTIQHGIPTEFGAKLINQVNAVYPLFFSS